MRLFTLLFLLVCQPALAAPATLFSDEFSDSAQWSLESGWRIDSGTLVGTGHGWAIPNVSYLAEDFTLRFRVRISNGGLHLNMRYGSVGRYAIGLRPGSSAGLFKQYFPDQFIDDLARGPASLSEGTWHEVEASVAGATLALTVDGSEIFSYTDPDPLVGGTFTFESLTEGGGEIVIDELRVEGDRAESFAPWIRTGGPLGGLGYDVRMSPDDSRVMYVTDAFSGVFKSIDGGASWEPSSVGISRGGPTGDNIPVFCLTVDPNEPRTLWAGLSQRRGLFKSTDAGANWERKDNGIVEEELTLRGITIDPSDSNTLYIAAEIPSWEYFGENRPGLEFDRSAGVIYKSTDGGENWRAVWRGGSLARYILINPHDTRVLYASTGIFDREAANSDPATRSPGGEGVLKSTDGGENWTAINNGLGNRYVGTLSLHPTNPEILIAGTGNNQYRENAGVYLTTDGGANWRSVLADYGVYTAVEFAPGDPNTVYAGGTEAFLRSRDGGHSWEVMSGGGYSGWGSPGTRSGFPIDIEVDPVDSNRLFVNNYGGGNFLSLDGGANWTNASNGYTGAQIRQVAVDPTNPARVIAAGRSGIFSSDDGGMSWNGISNAPGGLLEWVAVAIDPSNPRHLLSATNYTNSLLRSLDAGANWSAVTAPLGPRHSWHVIRFAPSDSSIVYAGSHQYYSAGTSRYDLSAKGIYRSHDNGASWYPVNGNLLDDGAVMSIAIHPGDPNTLYVAASNHGVAKTTNGGASWQLLDSGRAISVVLAANDPNIVIAGYEGGGVKRSTDGGASFSVSYTGMNPEATVKDLIADGVTGAIYAADSFSGVYRSSDNGATWTQINVNLTYREITALSISADGNHLYAASEGSGVFRLDMDETPPASLSRVTCGSFDPVTAVLHIHCFDLAGTAVSIDLNHLDGMRFGILGSGAAAGSGSCGSFDTASNRVRLPCVEAMGRNYSVDMSLIQNPDLILEIVDLAPIH